MLNFCDFIQFMYLPQITTLRVKILFHEQAKCDESVAASLKHAFSSLTEHLQFNFNSNVFIDQMVWYVPCMVLFVLKRGQFCPKRGPFCP